MIKSILRGVFVFLVGLCLVIWSSQAGEILLKALGVFLILSSVITVVYGLATNSYMDLKGMSLISIASAVLFLVVGLFLLLKTGFFMEFIGFVLGILLAIYGLLQLVVAVRNSKGIKDRFWRHFHNQGIKYTPMQDQAISTIFLIFQKMRHSHRIHEDRFLCFSGQQ